MKLHVRKVREAKNYLIAGRMLAEISNQFDGESGVKYICFGCR